jgi:hypothetical protein
VKPCGPLSSLRIARGAVIVSRPPGAVRHGAAFERGSRTHNEDSRKGRPSRVVLLRGLRRLTQAELAQRPVDPQLGQFLLQAVLP